jgi:hypothetical protein
MAVSAMSDLWQRTLRRHLKQETRCMGSIGTGCTPRRVSPRLTNIAEWSEEPQLPARLLLFASYPLV